MESGFLFARSRVCEDPGSEATPVAKPGEGSDPPTEPGLVSELQPQIAMTPAGGHRSGLGPEKRCPTTVRGGRHARSLGDSTGRFPPADCCAFPQLPEPAKGGVAGADAAVSRRPVAVTTVTGSPSFLTWLGRSRCSQRDIDLGSVEMMISS